MNLSPISFVQTHMYMTIVGCVFAMALPAENRASQFSSCWRRKIRRGNLREQKGHLQKKLLRVREKGGRRG